MATDLHGRVAAVTGASSGIGEATAVALAGAGAAVALGARRADRLKSVSERIEAEGGQAAAIEVDIADPDQAASFVRESRERLDRLDILVNNAGVMLLGPVDGADPDDWRRMVDVNVLGLLYCTHAALPIMREEGGGHIVNVSSTAGRRAMAGAAVYNLTKWGVVGFSEALRQEALHSNIRVTAVEPGFTDTELQGHNTNPVVREATKNIRSQIGEVLTAEDIAQGILYAVSQPGHVSVNEVLIRPTKQQG